MPHLRSCLPCAALGEPCRVLAVSDSCSPAAALPGFAAGAPAPRAQGKRASEALVREPAHKPVSWNVLLLFRHFQRGVEIIIVVET